MADTWLPSFEIDTEADVVRMTVPGWPCPDAPHDCERLGCGRTESWPVQREQP